MLGHHSSAAQLFNGPVIISEDLPQDVRCVLPKQGRRPGLWHLELTVSHSWACQGRRKAGSLLMTSPRKLITPAAQGVASECPDYPCQFHPCRCTIILERNVFSHVAFLDSVSSNWVLVICSVTAAWGLHVCACCMLGSFKSCRYCHKDSQGQATQLSGLWVPENNDHTYTVSLWSWKSDSSEGNPKAYYSVSTA